MERKGTLPSYQQVMELAEEKKDPQACMFLARYFFDGGEYLRGLHFFEEAALAGSIEGAKHAAMIYRSSASFISSLSSKEDMIIIRCGKKARQFMRIAAETGDNSCYLTLGDWYWSAAEDDAQDDDLEFDPNDADLDLTDGFSDILPAPTSADAKAARLERVCRRHALDAWDCGASNKNADCARKIADVALAAGDRMRAVHYWEMAAACGDSLSIRALSHHHAAQLAESAGTAVNPPVKDKGTAKLQARKDKALPAVGLQVKQLAPNIFKKRPTPSTAVAKTATARTGPLSTAKRSSFKPLVVGKLKPPSNDEGSSPVSNTGSSKELAQRPGGKDMKRSRDLAEARKTAQKFAKYASMAARERDGTSVLSLATYHVSGLAVVACDSKSRSRSPSIEDECAIPASRCGQLPPPLESVDVVPDVDCANFVEVVIARDPAAAVDMYVDAYTNCGVPASQSLTAAAEILLNEEGVERDVEKAMELYLAAARSEPIINSATALPSSGVSLVAIADAFRDGLGTKSGQPDFVKAWELYKEAAELGDSTALVRLGDSLRDGLGCEKNPTVAFGYYTKAAEVRDKEGIRRLAQCYWTGEGCEVDVVRAKKLAVEIGENHAF